MCKFNAIDLFCGAGGLSLGFQQAGFNIIVGVDNEPAALETFEFNHKGAIGLNADLSKQETFDLILKTAGDRKIDVIIAGPPCQGFSLTGPRNFDDPRNKLYLAVIKACIYQVMVLHYAEICIGHLIKACSLLMITLR